MDVRITLRKGGVRLSYNKVKLWIGIVGVSLWFVVVITYWLKYLKFPL